MLFPVPKLWNSPCIIEFLRKIIAFVAAGVGIEPTELARSPIVPDVLSVVVALSAAKIVSLIANLWSYFSNCDIHFYQKNNLLN